jgi:2',3'-cyclic-nucleotide 2'-phosphodiesterase (5'-nucleotidase family)
VRGARVTLLVSWMLAATIPARAQAPAPAEVLFHADLDGQLAAPDCDDRQARTAAGGPDLARVAGLLRAARTDPPGSPPITLLGGNLAGPALFGRALLGTGAGGGARLLAGLLARAGYDAVGLGHHDLSLPPPARAGLLAAIAARGIPVLLSNLHCPDRRGTCGLVSDGAIVQRGDQRIGVVAALSPLVLPGIPRASREGLVLDPIAPALARATRRLRAAGATRVLALAQGPRTPEWLAELVGWQRQLAGGPPAEAPDLLLAGGLGASSGGAAAGSLRLVEHDRAPPIVASSDGAAAVVRVAAAADGHVRVTRLEAGASAPIDPEVDAGLQPARVAYCDRYGGPLAGAGGEVRLPAPVDRQRFLGYVLAVMRRSAGAEIALVNRDFARAGAFPLAGRLTRADLLRALPYPDAVGRARVTGAALAATIAPALANARLVALGLERAPDGALTVNGRPLDRSRHYVVAANAFLASGGDGILPADALPLRVPEGAAELREQIERQLAADAAAGTTAAGPIAGETAAPARALVVGLADLALDLTSVAVRPQTGYQAPQLTRSQQRALKGELSLVGRLRSVLHEADGRLRLLYGRSRTQQPGAPPATGETADLVALSTLYDFRGLRRGSATPPPWIPDPYARLLLESELTIPPAVTAEDRRYRHAELTATAGVLFTPRPALRLRGGPGLRRQLLADGAAGRTRFLVEAGGTLDPVVLASFGPLQARLEALLDYTFIEPSGMKEHQLRASGKLAFPLLPLLYLTAGVDLFAMKRAAGAWGGATDTTVGLRLHLDGAHQRL